MIKAFMLVGVLATVAQADNRCHVVDVSFTAADDSGNAAAPMHLRPQIVVWLEDASGKYVDTLYITQQTGTYGLGNRPGRFDFNSGPLWPYGRRITTFPVWSHLAKQIDGYEYPFPEVEFRNGVESNLSHPLNQSSTELHFCQPLQTSDPRWSTSLDAISCASTNTDKGAFSATATTGYPPRTDVTAGGADSSDVAMYGLINPFDAVSQATPQNGQLAQITWPIPTGFLTGNYTVVTEVSKEFDFNSTYNPTSYPSPMGLAYGDFGLAYRGQPSVVYRVPIAISADGDVVALTDTYAGYGDPDGIDGNLRDADGTITTNVQGSGAARLALVTDPAGMYRVKVEALFEDDATPPAEAAEPSSVAVTGTTATVTWVAPGDDGQGSGRARGYDIRYRAQEPITDDNFASSPQARGIPQPDDPGQVQQIDLAGLLPQTDYYVAIRAYDECHNNSPLSVAKFTTTGSTSAEVDACFVATAAYGSVMANDVGMLRHFRDALLRDNVLGELFVETYYTFGPAVANVIDRSELLRSSARAALGPLVQFARRH